MLPRTHQSSAEQQILAEPSDPRQVKVLLHSLLRAERNAFAFRGHRGARLGGKLRVPVRQPDLRIFQPRQLYHLNALTLLVRLERLVERCHKLFRWLARSTGHARVAHGGSNRPMLEMFLLDTRRMQTEAPPHPVQRGFLNFERVIAAGAGAGVGVLIGVGFLRRSER